MCVIAYKKKSNLQGVLFILKKFSFTLLLIVIVRFIGDTTNIHIMSDYYYMNSVPTFVLFLGLIVSFRWYFSTITTMRKMPQTLKETKPVSVKETFDLYNNVIKILLNNQNYSWKK